MLLSTLVLPRIQGIHVKCKVSKYFDILITGYKMSTFKILNSSNLWQKMEQQAHWRLPYFTFKSSRYLHNICRVSHKSVLTLFLPFSRTKFIQNAKVGGVLKNSRNLLHDRHKNFENQFRNSWDNWGQSWQPSFRNLHFASTEAEKKILC